MVLPDDVYGMSVQEVIDELQSVGIQVTMVPMALMPDNLISLDGIGREPFGTVQTDIYTALQHIKNRSRIAYDPFS